MVIASHLDEPPHGDREIPVDRLALGKVGDERGGLGKLPASDQDASRLGSQESRDALQQG